MKYRRRTRKAAIFVGEVPKTYYPTVSEWGNPASFIAGHFMVKIPIRRDIAVTEGTI